MKFPKFERWVRKTANAFGIDITRVRHGQSATDRLAAMLKTNGVDVVLDIGANTGQFAMSLRAAGYTGRIVSFEALTTAHSALEEASKHDAHWDIAPREAIGAALGVVTFHISENSVSSSVLPMLDSHVRAAPSSHFIGDEQVRVAPLDASAIPFITEKSRIFLKIDTQGYEASVLDGAASILTRTVGVQLELSFVPLYEGQALFNDLLLRLQQTGFVLWAIWPGLVQPDTGRMLQVDAVLFRESSTPPEVQ